MHVSVLETNFSEVLTFTVDRNGEKVFYVNIVILKCNQIAIQYLVNVTLSLVVTPRHDKTLAMPISGFMQ